MNYKVCIVCNNKFHPNSSSHKCCSKECRRIHDNNLHKSYRDKNHVEEYRTCPTCGKEFIYNKYNLKYCSKDCKRVRDLKEKEKYRNDKKNKELQKIYQKEYRIKNKEDAKKYNIKYRKDNEEKLKIKNKEYCIKNKEKLKEIHQVTNREYYLKYNREYHKTYYPKNKEKMIQLSVKSKRKRRLEDPSIVIRDCLSQRLGSAINGKRGKSSFEYLDYNKDELIENITSKLKDGMTLKNYGHSGWHIDHIKPVAAFKLIKEGGELDLEQIKLCWALDNLQPLWAIDNIIKGAWYEVNGKICRFSNGEIVEIREDTA